PKPAQYCVRTAGNQRAAPDPANRSAQPPRRLGSGRGASTGLGQILQIPALTLRAPNVNERRARASACGQSAPSVANDTQRDDEYPTRPAHPADILKRYNRYKKSEKSWQS